MKLKPCPFCGNEVYLRSMDGFGVVAYIIHCEECGIGTDFRDDKEKCIRNWNKRAQEEK